MAQLQNCITSHFTEEKLSLDTEVEMKIIRFALKSLDKIISFKIWNEVECFLRNNGALYCINVSCVKNISILLLSNISLLGEL